MIDDYKSIKSEHNLEQGKEPLKSFVPITYMSNSSNFKVISEGFYEFISFDDDDYYNKNERHGVIDCSGREIVPPYFDYIVSVNYESSIYFIGISENKSYLYDQKGNSIEWELLQSCGFSQIYKFKIGNKEISISNHGEIIIPPLYDNIENIGFKFGWFKIQKDNLWGIWKNDFELYPPIYEEIYCEELNGFLSHRYETTGDAFSENSLDNIIHGIKIKQKGKIGIIDYSERFLAPKYEDIKIISDNCFAIRLFKKWGIIDSDEKIIITPKYEELIFEDEIFIVKKGNAYGCVNIKDEIIIPFIYDLILNDNNGVLWAKKDNKRYKLETDGTIVSETIFIKDYSLGYDELEMVFEHDSCNINLFTDFEHIDESKR